MIVVLPISAWLLQSFRLSEHLLQLDLVTQSLNFIVSVYSVNIYLHSQREHVVLLLLILI